jgi:uncharacterized repeat protein (TIGR02543 family)
MPLMPARVGLILLLLLLASSPLAAGTLIVQVHASHVENDTENGYIGSLGEYYWERGWWEQSVYFSIGVTHVIVGASYWHGTLVSDSWSNYLRSGHVEQGQCYTAMLSVQVFTPDSSSPITSGNAESGTACVPVYCNLYAWKVLQNDTIHPFPQTGKYLCGTSLYLYIYYVEEGWQFDGWSGDVTSSDLGITVNINGDNVSVFANFSRVPPPPPPPPETQPGGEIQPPCNPCTPIVINFADGGYRLTGANDPVLFDIQAIGRPLRIGWTAAGADEAFLALDRNGNGTIDSGAELFGDATPLKVAQTADNGFVALAEFDDDHDGIVDESDSIWDRLKLWFDLNHDGISQPSEIRPAAGSRLVAISLNYHSTRRRDNWGNTYRYESRVWISKAGKQATPVPFTTLFS